MTELQVPSIRAHELRNRVQRGERLALLDVRTPDEYEAIHAAGAILIPLDQFTSETVVNRLAAEGLSSTDQIYVLCHSGRRAMTACERVIHELPNVVHIQGGTLAWAQEGLPVVSGGEPNET
ncbi:Rhodanese-like domain protein [mine drainage metagenome]|uniref:Rhodanese-like domain protein n=1 Tax=mine drainage metagenome TaxID=410659 RepID=T1BAV5_9ZZZZ